VDKRDFPMVAWWAAAFSLVAFGATLIFLGIMAYRPTDPRAQQIAQCAALQSDAVNDCIKGLGHG